MKAVSFWSDAFTSLSSCLFVFTLVRWTETFVRQRFYSFQSGLNNKGVKALQEKVSHCNCENSNKWKSQRHIRNLRQNTSFLMCTLTQHYTELFLVRELLKLLIYLKWNLLSNFQNCLKLISAIKGLLLEGKVTGQWKPLKDMYANVTHFYTLQTILTSPCC